ncbi:hypothetical protein A5678_10970 [Mycobacterium sp. E2733]|nr:hypothetical protein A5678_10970 [Mycobacterium sp. E2733]
MNLADIKRVKNRFGVKVEDVVMALVSAVLRQFLADRIALPDSPLVASVRVSGHDKSDRPRPQPNVGRVLQPAYRHGLPSCSDLWEVADEFAVGMEELFAVTR